MSSSSADLINLISSALLEGRIGLGSVALPAYEYLITLDEEIRLIWKRKKTGATVLFLLIRYHALVAMVFLQGISTVPMSDNVCSTYVKVQAAMQFSQYIVWAAFSALRALALSGMNWAVASVVFVLACGPFAVNLWQMTAVGVFGFNVPAVGCIGSSNVTAAEAKIGTAVSRSCVIAADLLVIVISWWYAVKDRSIRDMLSSPMSLTRVMVLNGTTYFLALTLLNILHLTLTLLSLVGVADQISPVTIFVDPLTAILICRFLLDLHATNVKSTHDVSSEHHLGWEGSSLHFMSMVQSMGGTIAASTEPDSITLKDFENGATVGDSSEVAGETA